MATTAAACALVRVSLVCLDSLLLLSLLLRPNRIDLHTPPPPPPSFAHPTTKTVVRNHTRYMQFLRKRTLTNPKKGPFHYRAPSRILWRTVRRRPVFPPRWILLTSLENSQVTHHPTIHFPTTRSAACSRTRRSAARRR